MIDTLKFEDIDQVSKIESLCFDYPWTKQNFIDSLNNKELCKSFVCRENNTVVAFGCIWLLRDKCDVVNIAVAPSSQGKGYGQQILAKLIDEARVNKCRNIHLEVRYCNEPAIKLYKANGFKIVNTKRAYYPNGDDAFDMEKLL